LFVIICALFPPPPDKAYLHTEALIPRIEVLITETRTDAGLADYWTANLIRFLSNEKIPMGEISGDSGKARYWENDPLWFKTDGMKGGLPKYGFILLDGINETAILSRYGPPKRVENYQNTIAWIYSQGNSIKFNPLFGDVGNSNSYSSDVVASYQAINLPSATGQIAGTSRVARSGRDSAGHLVYGPYLDPIPGRYCIKITYQYLIQPDSHNLSFFECIIHTATGEIQLDRAPLRFENTAQTLLIRSVTIPDVNSGKEGLETRIQYEGSGDLKIDSVTIEFVNS